MKIPTDKQIQAEIKKLEELRPKICRYTAFGDDNWNGLDAQLQVLREDLSESDIDEMHDEAVELEDDCMPFYKEDAYSQAREAALWLTGESEYGAPSNGWKGLVGKTAKPLNSPEVEFAKLNAKIAEKKLGKKSNNK